MSRGESNVEGVRVIVQPLAHAASGESWNRKGPPFGSQRPGNRPPPSKWDVTAGYRGRQGGAFCGRLPIAPV